MGIGLQYALSPLGPPTVGTFAKSISYLGLATAISSSELLRSADNLINLGHRSLLFLNSGEAGDFSKDRYQQRAAADPQFASLYGWRSPLRWATRVAEVALGAAVIAWEYGKYVDRPGRLGLAPTLLWTGAHLLFTAGFRFVSDLWGNAKGRPTGDWQADDFCWNLWSAEWATAILMTPIISRVAKVAVSTADLLFSRRHPALALHPDVVRQALGGKGLLDPLQRSYLGLITLIGGTIGFPIVMLRQLTLGFRDIVYLLLTSSAGYIRPLPSRFLFIQWRRRTDQPLSLFGYLAPVSFLVQPLIEVWNQTQESIVHKHRELAESALYCANPAERSLTLHRLARKEEDLNRTLEGKNLNNILNPLVRQQRRIQKFRQRFPIKEVAKAPAAG